MACLPSRVLRALEPPCGPEFVPRFLSEALRLRLRVTDEVRKTVVFVGIEANGSFLPLGTGLLALVEYEWNGNKGSYHFLVTAKHVIDQVSGSDFWIRVNRLSAPATSFRFAKSSVVAHPDPANDIAIAFVKIWEADFDRLHYPVGRELYEESKKRLVAPGVGDEVAIVGLYTSHYGQTKSLPVIRIGHIAAMPEEPVRTGAGYVEAYLVEVKSIAGLSGSPVYLNPPHLRARNGKIEVQSGDALILIGILVGYHVVESAEDQIQVPKFQPAKTAGAGGSSPSIDERNTGFAVVIPIERIFEILETPDMKAKFEKTAADHFAKSGYRPASATAPENVSASGEKNAAPTAQEHKAAFNSLLSAAAKTKKQDD